MKNKNGIKKAISFLMLCFFLVSVSMGAYAQKTVSGTISEASGQPLPGVTVLIKGTTTGAITDFEGKYIVTNVPETATLVFSFVGMLDEEVPFSDQTTIDVTMIEDLIKLDELVVVGYGTQSKRFVTGSISSIDRPVRSWERLIRNLVSD